MLEAPECAQCDPVPDFVTALESTQIVLDLDRVDRSHESTLREVAHQSQIVDSRLIEGASRYLVEIFIERGFMRSVQQRVDSGSPRARQANTECAIVECVDRACEIDRLARKRPALYELRGDRVPDPGDQRVLVGCSDDLSNPVIDDEIVLEADVEEQLVHGHQVTMGTIRRTSGEHTGTYDRQSTDPGKQPLRCLQGSPDASAPPERSFLMAGLTSSIISSGSIM